MVALVTAPLYTLEITLLGTEPPVWRRVVVRGSIGLEDLHLLFQEALGWTNSHLHQFIVGTVFYGEPDPDFDAPLEDESDFTLSDLGLIKGATFRYEYDFGDGWLHEITVENIEDDSTNLPSPRCLAGARRCPPEDVGGIPGYMDLVEAMKKPKSKSCKELVQWLGEPFDPEAFDLAKTNKQLSKLKYK